MTNIAQKPKDKCIHAHIDYGTFHFPITSIEGVELIMGFLNRSDEPWKYELGLHCVGNYKFYDHKIYTGNGIIGGFSLPDSEMKDSAGQMILQMSGTYWANRNVVDQWRICMGLHYAYKARCTRLDIAIDDINNNVIPVQQMRDAVISKDYARFLKWSVMESGGLDEDSMRTDYYGTRLSDKFVRVYPHNNEYMRFEAEFHREYADEIFRKIAATERDYEAEVSDEQMERKVQRMLASYALGTLDFVDRHKNGEYERILSNCERFPWYQKFIDEVGEHLRVRVPRKESTVQRNIRFMKRQVFTSLRSIRLGLGLEKWQEWFQDMMAAVCPRERARHRIIEETIRNYPEICWSS